MSMTSYDVVMPKLGLTMTEGTVSQWQVRPGDVISTGDILCMFETDKTVFEIESEHAGTVLEIDVPEGTTVEVGTRLARISIASVAPALSGESGGAQGVASSDALQRSDDLPDAQSTEPIVGRDHPPTRIVATPYARRIAREAVVDLGAVAGTGPAGRIKAADVRTAALRARTAPPDGSPHLHRARVSTARAAMARRVSESKPGIPHFYLTSEAEVSTLEALRGEWQVTRGEPPPTITHFIVAAVGRSLLEFPEANAVWADGRVASLSDADVGLVVHSNDGLFLPVVRDAGRKSLLEIASDTRDLVARARAGRLVPDEMTGGAIAISNAGMHDVTYLTPIVNPGQSAMLGVGSVRQVFRPDAQGRPVLHRELGLVLAADHRVFDGVSGLVLLNRITSYLESPRRLLPPD
jgi:pyruvate dehydrogenase E2 component (dihydrolipoamide acetyltransferase)